MRALRRTTRAASNGESRRPLADESSASVSKRASWQIGRKSVAGGQARQVMLWRHPQRLMYAVLNVVVRWHFAQSGPKAP